MTTTKRQTSSRPRLTAKQEAFCVNYISLRNATQSAIKAGYSPHLINTHSTLLLQNATIKQRIAELQANQPLDPDIADAMERRRILTGIARYKTETPVTAGQRTTAIDTLNRLDKLYTPDSGVPATVQININVVDTEAKALLARVLANPITARRQIIEGNTEVT